MKIRKINLYPWCLSLLVGLLSYSCTTNEAADGGQAIAEYKVLKVSQQDINVYKEFPGTIEGIENIEIRPKIEGFIEKVLADEGDYVAKGQVLFLLNAPEYEQDILNAEAAINSAKAEVSSAEINVEKAKPLVEREIISSFELTAAQNVLIAKKAALKQVQTVLVNAQTNLGYARITAPVSGYVGSLPYKVGSLVSSSNTDPLTTISNIKQVYAYFSINEKSYLEFSKAGLLDNTNEVSLLLPDYTMFDQKGRIQTVSGQVDEETGSFRVRAIFDNPESLLRTGNSATIQLPRVIDNAMLIPQSATYELQGDVYTYVIDSESKAKSTKIAVTPTISGQGYIVTSGLQSGDQVIIEGINTLSSGKEIKAMEVDASTITALQVD